jgi:hypothetical protein
MASIEELSKSLSEAFKKWLLAKYECDSLYQKMVEAREAYEQGVIKEVSDAPD